MKIGGYIGLLITLVVVTLLFYYIMFSAGITITAGLVALVFVCWSLFVISLAPKPKKAPKKKK